MLVVPGLLLFGAALAHADERPESSGGGHFTLPAYGARVQFDTPPAVIDSVAPDYPEIAREAGVDGVVLFAVLVRRDSSVAATRLLRPIPMLDAAAEASIERYRFAPARLSGRPVDCWLDVPVRFELPGDQRLPRAAMGPGRSAHPLLPDCRASHHRPFPDFGVAATLDSLPVPIHPVIVSCYDGVAREVRLEAHVSVYCLVCEHGRVIATHMGRTVPTLETCAQSAVRRWTFRPARLGRRAVSAWIEVPVTIHAGY
jgi:TonB family protein